MTEKTQVIYQFSEEEIKVFAKEIAQETVTLIEREEKVYSSREACRKLNISWPTLKGYIDEGLIAGVKNAGRYVFSEEELDKADPLVQARRGKHLKGQGGVL